MNKINKFTNALYHLAYIDGKDEMKGELTDYINQADNKAAIYKLVNFDDVTSLVYSICESNDKATVTASYYIAKSDGKNALECAFLCEDDYMDTDKYHENFVIVSDGAPNSDDGGKSIVKSGAKADPTPTQTVYYIDVNTGLVYDKNYEVIGYYETYPDPQPAPINRLSVPREKGIIKTPGRLVPTKPNKTIVEPKYVRDLESNKSLDVILKDLGKGIGDVVTELYEDPTAEHKTIKPELLPSYVDDVIEGYMTDDTFYDEDDNPIIPEKGKIYLDVTTNKSYRWTGSEYYEFSENPVLLGHVNIGYSQVQQKEIVSSCDLTYNEIKEALLNGKLVILYNGNLKVYTLSQFNNDKVIFQSISSSTVIHQTDNLKSITVIINNDDTYDYYTSNIQNLDALYQNELDDLINNNKLIRLRLYFAIDTNKLYFAISSNTVTEITTTSYTPSI